MVSDEELEVQVEKQRPNNKHVSGDDLECDQIGNYETTGPAPVAGRLRTKRENEQLL